MSQVASTIVEAFVKSPAGQALVAEREREALAKRTALVAKAAKLREDHAKVYPKLMATEASAERDVIAARAAVEKAEAALREARVAMYGASATFDGNVARIEATLRETSSESIGEFLSELIDLDAISRRPGVTRYHTTLGPRNLVSDHREEITRSNIASIERRLASIRATREAAERLQLEAISTDEVAQRLRELRANIPAVSDELELE